MNVPAVLPSPTQGVWQLGPVPIRAYALCILAGIVFAIWLGDRRWRARGGQAGLVGDIAAWAVPFGIVGGRLYHVATSWQPYFGPGGRPIEALYVWQGGLGIWGAVALGTVGAWIGARRAGVLLPPLADALAPGVVIAQAIGRLGNWFNNELYGSPTTLPWGLRIHEWDNTTGQAVRGADGLPVVLGTFHPTFLYEALWNLGVAAVLIWADRRFRIGHGRVFALYVLLYTIGRFWIEALRVDPANQVLGLRLNLWTSVIVGLGALVYLVLSARLRPGRETSVVRPGAKALQPPTDADDTSDPAEQGATTDAASPAADDAPGRAADDAPGPAADDAPVGAVDVAARNEPGDAPDDDVDAGRGSTRSRPADTVT